MKAGLEQFRASFNELRSEAISLAGRLRKAGQGLHEQTVKSRELIRQSRELMVQIDEIDGPKAS